MMLADKLVNLKSFFQAQIPVHCLRVVLHNRKNFFYLHLLIQIIGLSRQLPAGTTAQQPATPAATQTSQFVSVLEAEKQTAAALAAINTKGQKTLSQPRTPGKNYNWDG